MATSEQPAKIYCLYHQKTDCVCIAPVTSDAKLRARLQNAIRINEINNRFQANDEVKMQCEAEMEDFRRRLAQL